MKLKFLTAFFLTFSLFAQEHTVEKFPNRLRLSWETVAMSTEPDLGFFGIGVDLYRLVKKKNTVYVGLSSYSAVTGIRPGLITLGMSAGYRPRLGNNWYADIGGFIGGGGGGGADDGGGLILRPHLELERTFGNIGVQFGVSRIDFPSGSIQGNQVNVGLTFHGANYLKVPYNATVSLKETQNTNFKKLRFAIVGTQYMNLAKGSVNNPSVSKVGLVGMQLESEMNEYFYSMLKLNGAFSGGTDGYMSVFLGLGAKYPFLYNRLFVEGRILAGPTGGGAINTGGGATTQFEGGVDLGLGKGYDLKLMAGKTLAPWGPFDANHIEIGIGKTFERIVAKKDIFNVDAKDYYENKMGFALFNRVYFPPKANTKTGVPYLNSFNSLGIEIQKYLSDRFSINGGTVWAYQGDYGAYAEGLLGATYYQPVFDKTKLTLKGMFGAAGGGDLDTGSGLVVEYAFGLERSLSNRWDFFVNIGQTVPIEGNFKPISLDFGLKFNATQLIKKG